MLKVENLSFAYDKTPVLKSIDFKVKKGENIAIIGESGSGKSTLLNLIYGKHDLEFGKIYWKDEQILGPAHNLVIGYDFMKYVSQEFDLMPFITVEENIGKHVSNFYKNEKKKRTQELMHIVELEAFSKTKVKNLSGGQKQRVALARALAKQPEILLLDEPFSHIDNFKKQSLRRSVFKFLKENSISCLVASHDKDDVLGFADRMIVLHQKKIIAYDSPEKLYRNPKNVFIASFFGEFTLFKPSELNGNTSVNDDIIVNADQLKVVPKSGIKVEVIKSYFKASYYLIEASFNGRSVFFQHNHSLEPKKEVYLEILQN